MFDECWRFILHLPSITPLPSPCNEHSRPTPLIPHHTPRSGLKGFQVLSFSLVNGVICPPNVHKYVHTYIHTLLNWLTSAGAKIHIPDIRRNEYGVCLLVFLKRKWLLCLSPLYSPSVLTHITICRQQSPYSVRRGRRLSTEWERNLLHPPPPVKRFIDFCSHTFNRQETSVRVTWTCTCTPTMYAHNFIILKILQTTLSHYAMKSPLHFSIKHQMRGIDWD